MKIMTFNTQHCMNYMTREIDFEVMANAILSEKADIVGLNEMYNYAQEENLTLQTQKLSKLTGLEHHFFAEAIEFSNGRKYGNGLLSRFPIVSAESIPVPDPEVRCNPDGYYETRCLLKAKLENGITVLAIHFGLNPDEHLNAVKTVCKHLVDEKCILMGDFNVLPDDPVLAPIRAKMKDTADLFAGERMSFPSDAPDRKIDYVFVSPDVEVLSADIPAIVASDHRPHTAEVNL